MKKKVFMIMDFSDGLANVAYEHCIKRVCQDFDLEIRRADEVFTANPVYEDILREIREAAIIIADISTKNPNVYYELGMSHILKQSQTMMITHQSYDDLPFDVSHFRILHYDDSITGSRSFEKQLALTLDTLLRNYKEIYRDEFELIADVLVSSSRGPDIYALIALMKTDQIVRTNQQLKTEGTNPAGSHSATHSFTTFTYDPFVKMGFVTLLGDQFLLTEKGQAFASFLQEKGFDCHLFNDIELTPGYTSKFPKEPKREIQQTSSGDIATRAVPEK